MELEIFEALTAANVPADRARAVVASINKEIDRRYELHSRQQATRGDVEGVRKEIGELRGDAKAEIAKAQAEIVKWCMASIFGAVALFATVTKIWH